MRAARDTPVDATTIDLFDRGHPLYQHGVGCAQGVIDNSILPSLKNNIDTPARLQNSTRSRDAGAWPVIEWNGW